ncbi:MAG: phosphate signaling complex protein PhoU [Oscillospiraceae bacterium]|nr:phosphate signaling complex protein PhoU [Oscillospiraceae bacterium]
MNNRKNFDMELEELSESLVRMGAQVTDAIDRAMQALFTRDRELAHEVIKGDNLIDEEERSIEQQCLHLLLRQQPVARDLRVISTAIKMITDIERIGDHAADISEISLHIERAAPPELEKNIMDMAKAACGMASNAIKAYVNEDLELAAETCLVDDVVDGYFVKIREMLATRMGNEPGQMEEAIDYLMVIKYLERVGDHAENICEWVEFYLTGIHKNEKIL